jgi:hypothetical protein
LRKNPSNLKRLLGFHFAAGIDRNNINNLACRFKSPRNHTHIASGREISQTIGSFRGVDISLPSIGKRLFWRRRVVCDV